jgi:hypothetical protein
MSLKDKGNRIVQLRDDIRSKILSLGIITDSSAKLSKCEEAIEALNTSAITASSIAVTPNVTINKSTGVVTVSGNKTGAVSANKGYSSGVSKSVSATAKNTLSLDVQAGQNITPKTYDQTIAANRWLTGNQVILGDADLKAANIKKGVSIFGVTGNASTITSSINSKGKLVLGKSWTISSDLNNYKVSVTVLKRRLGTENWYETSMSCLQITNLGFTPVVAWLSSNTNSGTDYMQYVWMTSWGALVYRQTSGNSWKGHGYAIAASSLSMTASKLLIPVEVATTSRNYTVTAYGYY